MIRPGSDRGIRQGSWCSESERIGAEVLVIVRIWRGWVATETRDNYVNYIVDTGPREYRETPGNLGAQMLTRDVGNGRTEVLTVSWWVSMESIRRLLTTTSRLRSSTHKMTSTSSSGKPL